MEISYISANEKEIMIHIFECDIARLLVMVMEESGRKMNNHVKFSCARQHLRKRPRSQRVRSYQTIGAFLCGVCICSLCLCGFPKYIKVSYHNP